MQKFSARSPRHYPVIPCEARREVRCEARRPAWCEPTTITGCTQPPAKRVQPRQTGISRLAILMLLALVSVSAGVWFGQWQQANKPNTAGNLDQLQNGLANTLLFPEDYKTLPAFSLIDENNEPVDETSFQGKWSMMFFGFTHCPDICPITLSVLRDARELLVNNDSATAPFQTVFVSVDPNRDTPAMIKPYISSFGTDVRAITGDLNGILELTRELSIVVSYNAREDDPSDYSVDHTSSILLVDPQSRIRAKFNLPHEVDTIADDYKQVVTALGS